jgi:hypothetical protein
MTDLAASTAALVLMVGSNEQFARILGDRL